MSFTLQAFKEDALASDMTDSASSLTLVTGAFGTPTGEQMLVIDPDISAKREIVKCTIDGATVTSVDRAQDGTSAVAHSSGAKVIMAFVPSHYEDLKNNGVLGYAERTSNFVTTSTTAVQVTGLTVTVTVPSGGRRIKITVWANNSACDAITYSHTSIWEGTPGSGTQLTENSVVSPSADYSGTVSVMAVVTPSAGSHTYNVGFRTSGGGATATMAAGATYPAFILVEYLGGS